MTSATGTAASAATSDSSGLKVTIAAAIVASRTAPSSTMAPLVPLATPPEEATAPPMVAVVKSVETVSTSAVQRLMVSPSGVRS